MIISKSGKSNDMIDLTKFIMSALIAAMHTQLFGGVIYPVTRLAVPVFFVFSSYLFFSKHNQLSAEKKNTHFFGFVRRNLLLYLFWFVVLFPLTMYIGTYYKMPFMQAVFKLLKNFFFASTFQASWYIMALVIGTVIVVFLSKKLCNGLLFIVGTIFYALSCLSSNYIFILLENQSLYDVYHSITDIIGLPCRNFAVSIIYIVLGKIIAEKYTGKQGIKKHAFSLAVSLALLFAECFVIKKSGVTVFDNDCFAFLVPVSFFIAILCVNSKISVPYAETLRKISTVVYCAHMPVFMVVGKIISLADINDELNILAFTSTIILTWFLALVILRLEKIKVFGFLKYSH